MDSIPQLINRLYLEAGLLTADGNGLPAHDHCVNSQQCWGNEPPHRIPSGDNAIASLPWIGPNYQDHLMLLVGENLFDCGGVHALDALVRSAQEELRRGQYRVSFGNPKYHSFFWYRAAAYATVWLNYLSGLAQSLDQHPESVADTFESIAVTNQVKCSPVSSPDARSTPNPRMWAHCGSTILRQEVVFLNAKRIIVLGTGNNFQNLVSNLEIPGNSERMKHSKNIVTIKDVTRGREVLAVRHPAAPGGNANRLLPEVMSALLAACFTR